MTSHEVDSLRPATAYLFRVAAGNEIGTGEYSGAKSASTFETGEAFILFYPTVTHTYLEISFFQLLLFLILILEFLKIIISIFVLLVFNLYAAGR